MHLLTIAIPTHNRAAKVGRLLDDLIRQIREQHLQNEIDIMVSDNASDDDTESVVARRQGGDVGIVFTRQPANLGFDGNMLSLYRQAQSRFIWWMGSDDFPAAGMMPRIIDILKSHDPDMITGSFRQPNTGKVFDFRDPVVIVNDPKQCIEYLRKQQKISSQVLRRIELDDSQLELLQNECGNGWVHFLLAFTVLASAHQPQMALVSDYVAVCDEDYGLIEWTPECYLQMHRAMRHPFVAKFCPRLEDEIKTGGYRTSIGLCFAVKTGNFRALSMRDYDRFIRDLDWRPGVLIKHPGTLLRFAALKSGTAAHLRPLTRYVMPWLRRLRPAQSNPGA